MCVITTPKSIIHNNINIYIFIYLLDLTAFVTFLKTSFRSLILDDKTFKWKSENCLVFYKTNIVKLH